MSDLPQAVELTPAALQLRWPDGAAELPAARLRAVCRCGGYRARAERGEPAPALAELVDAVPVGRYALNLIFSDGHDRGIYPWTWLRELGPVNAAT
ncbi:DUF971 domain-containing protein [Roseateles sp. P5_E4]